MTDNTSLLAGPDAAGIRPPATERLPWRSLLILGGATFTMVTAEMLPAAVLPQMSDGLGVSEAQVGLLVSVWAAAVVIGSFPLVRLTRRLDRRTVIAAALVALAASTLLTAVAPVYPIAAAARVVGALAVGLLWATTNALTADLVPGRSLSRAVAVVLGGATLGTVIGVPLASVLAQAIGWRAAFVGVAGVALAAALAVRFVTVPASADGSAPDTTHESAASDREPVHGVRLLLTVTLLVSLLLVGHYGAFTFITRLVEPTAVSVPGGTGTMLFLFGLASAAGIALAGRFGERPRLALVIAAFATGVAVLALSFVEVHAVVGVVVVIAWAVVSGALPALAQTLIMQLAGPERRGFAGALIPVVFNLGIAAGAALASLVVTGPGIAALPVVAATVIGIAAAGLVLVLRPGGAAVAR
ncbi:MFS transporter [Microbacterium bovistercoris]|uniref:MFS transporter n=1 Tax=Microbacterium bovistercoris TaxID=2293570 RepID=A0A371NYB3_9MICO|nr:MFS transporter [Microbacterium bovistercoris]REJ08553.1 MFS transporter [Microbacterium bovistercoris]